MSSLLTLTQRHSVIYELQESAAADPEILRSEKSMRINEVAKLTGLTVRALHHYDNIGLLSPETEASGYRNYSREDLERLQEIMFFRELDFSLTEIKRIVDAPDFDRAKAMKNQRELLQKKFDRMKKLIGLIDKLLNGDDELSFKEFDESEIEKMKNMYAEEAKSRWGNTEAYKVSEKKTSTYTESDWNRINGEAVGVFRAFAAISDPASAEAQSLVARWQQLITNTYYPCTDEILSGLGEMYVLDERFTKSLDAYGEGTARMMSEAIKIYCEKKEESGFKTRKC